MPVERDGEINNAYEVALSRYASRPNVTGVDVGWAYEAGEPIPDSEAIRIHVREKVDSSTLSMAEAIPSEIAGVRVDVIEASYRPHSMVDDEDRLPRNGWHGTIQPGMSVSHTNARTGTIGLIVFDLQTGQPCILSNWHVLAGSNNAQANDPVVQPGSWDGGSHPTHTVGGLHRVIIDQRGDAAIAPLLDVRNFTLEQYVTGDRLTNIRDPAPNETLIKSGRTTGVTEAVVEGIGRYQVDYHELGYPIMIDGFKLRPKIRTNPRDEEISYDGDSGSVWYNSSELAGIGLHVAGEVNRHPAKEHAIACFLSVVVRDLSVSLDPIFDEWTSFSSVDEIDLFGV